MACKIRDKAQRPSAFISQPCKRLTSSTPELHAQLNLTRVTKRKWPHLKSCACLGHLSWNAWRSCLSVTCWSSIPKKTKCWRSWRLRTLEVPEKGESLERRAVVQPNDFDRVKIEKWPAVSLYLNELLIQKCQFRDHFKVSILCLDKHSPKGSCHLDESSMNHTLAQKHLCELWCGMHRTYKNTSVKPDRKWWVTRREKQCKGILSTSLLDAIVPSEPTRDLPNGKVVFGLATSHCRKLIWKMKQVRRWASPSISQATDECLC